MNKYKKLTLTAVFISTMGIFALVILCSCGKKPGAVPKKQWYFGYNQEIQGETIVYHSPQPDADEALLVRSQDKNRFIEWETETIPEDFSENLITFVWMAGIDALMFGRHLPFSDAYSVRDASGRFARTLVVLGLPAVLGFAHYGLIFRPPAVPAAIPVVLLAAVIVHRRFARTDWPTLARAA